jgi:hypothetical protein
MLDDRRRNGDEGQENEPGMTAVYLFNYHQHIPACTAYTPLLDPPAPSGRVAGGSRQLRRAQHSKAQHSKAGTW